MVTGPDLDGVAATRILKALQEAAASDGAARTGLAQYDEDRPM